MSDNRRMPYIPHVNQAGKTVASEWAPPKPRAKNPVLDLCTQLLNGFGKIFFGMPADRK